MRQKGSEQHPAVHEMGEKSTICGGYFLRSSLLPVVQLTELDMHQPAEIWQTRQSAAQAVSAAQTQMFLQGAG